MSDYIKDIYSDKAYNWLMFIKHNNLGFLRKDSLLISPNKVEQDQSEEALDSYQEVNDQIIGEFGFQESFMAQKELQQDIAFLKLDYIINDNKMKRTEWRIKEAQLNSEKEQQDQGEDMSLSKEVAIVSQILGVGIIDIKDYSIFQYLTAKNSSSNGK